MEDLQAVLDAGSALGAPKAVGVGQYAVVPEEWLVKDLDEYLEKPRRAEANVTAKSAETFSAYVLRFKTDATAIFADQQAFNIVGIIDYHAPGAPAFRKHRVSYAAPRSLEWATWRPSSGRKMSQADFAQFIEDNVVDIRSPAGAEVLEVARGLQAKKAVSFASAIRLSDGSQEFTYNETIQGTTAKGKLKVPEEFVLGIPVFLGGELYEVTARLRYRINDGQLALWYELYRPEHIEKDAFEAVCTDINENTNIDIWQGVP